jgi:rod shape determining protein RodA
MRGTGLQLPRATIGVSRWRRFRAAVDWPLIVAVCVLCAIGLLNLYSAVRGTRHHPKFETQLHWNMTIGAIAFVVATVIDYRALVRLAWIGLWVAIVMLVVVQLLGDTSYGKGSARWINLGVRIQPSELAKLMVILALARWAQDGDVDRYSPTALGARVIALALPIGLIAIQPDLGSAVLLGLMILTVGFLVMQSVWPMGHVTLAGLLAIPILWETMHDYQKNRVLAFLDPSSDPTGNGWHTRQSIFAVGSGKIWGKGYGEGTQNQFDFLPEHWTDFPFSV